jgi:hypothetical protein
MVIAFEMVTGSSREVTEETEDGLLFMPCVLNIKQQEPGRLNSMSWRQLPQRANSIEGKVSDAGELFVILGHARKTPSIDDVLWRLSSNLCTG